VFSPCFRIPTRGHAPAAATPPSCRSVVQGCSPGGATVGGCRKLCGLSSLVDSGAQWRVSIGIVEREARVERPSAKHAHLVEIYGTPDPGLSPEQALRRPMLARYHTMLAKAALRREALKVKPSVR
jgi:hypothetical protein